MRRENEDQNSRMAPHSGPVTLRLDVHAAGWRVDRTRVLENVSFSVTSGEFVALMGRNGAGKSTLLDLVAGLRRPSDGEIVIDGRVLDEWSARDLARTVVHLPQVIRADVAFSVEEFVLMGRYPHAIAWNESERDLQVAESAMRRCACTEFRGRRLSTLSGGERQRVLLAACLAQQPRLLLLDEPATFLDVEQQLQCFRMLREEVEGGAACLAVTHDINLALTFCSRLLVLADGELAADLSIDAATEDSGWLRWFSSRLEMARTRSGRPWVYYG
jgi:ABC-type cobalamin/Fe3+-siderophores transport system ATPase subunit